MKALLLFLPAFFVLIHGRVEYRCLKAMGVDCPPRDTCASNVGLQFFGRSCACDSQCHFFNDCCLDAAPQENGNEPQERSTAACLAIDPSQGVYAIDKCSSSWNDSDTVSQKCENQQDTDDPLMYLPCTDTHTNITYANRYCSECNYARPQDRKSWIVSLTCPSLEYVDMLYHNITQDFILDGITKSEGFWGVYHWNSTLGDMVFYPCEISFQLPGYLANRVRFCHPNVISTCPDKWSCSSVRKYCSEYMAVIYFGTQAYRNAHCAICNHVSIRNPTCAWTLIRGPSLSFTVLLDVNPSDGDKVGETNPCSSNEEYDPFFKKCRKLVCAIPGHVYKDGRCVKQ